jgi:hypothetical protein
MIEADAQIKTMALMSLNQVRGFFVLAAVTHPFVAKPEQHI